MSTSASAASHSAVVLVTGATGFLGTHFIRTLAANPAIEVRAVARGAGRRALPDLAGVRWVDLDLDRVESVRAFIDGADTLVHLAYPYDWNGTRHRAMATALARQAKDAGVGRVVLCSTAIVVGKTSAQRVNEDTPCRPMTEYETTKLDIERIFATETQGACELVVLRPTAIFGPGGKNLLKLAAQLAGGHRFLNYLRASLYGRRRMNLVCVENVVAALEFVRTRAQDRRQDTFIVSDEDEPANNFQDVEAALSRRLGLGAYTMPPVTMPRSLLLLALRLAGRTGVDPDQVFDGGRLRAAGFRKALSLADGLESFAAWYRARL